MAKHGGFEGNGQTLRILTELIYERPGRTKGIAPTRAFLDGVMKYKATQGDWLKQTGKAPKNHFIYDEQAQWRDQVFGGATSPQTFSKLRRSINSRVSNAKLWIGPTTPLTPCTTLSTASTLAISA